MGSVESRFHEQLATGSIKEALDLWKAERELQDKADMNLPVRGGKNKDPPLHCLLRTGNYRTPEFKELMTILLDKGAKPTDQNANFETAIHIVCSSQRCSARENRARCEALRILLDRLPSCSVKDAVDAGFVEQSYASKPGARCLTEWLGRQDKSQNTALHLAATSGLLECVELLLAYGAPLFSVNIARKTPLETAVDAKQMVIAQFLESQMVMVNKKSDRSDSDASTKQRSQSQSYVTAEQLKEMQQNTVIELSERIHVSNDVARALLAAYSWSKDLVITAWEKDKKDACAKAGIDHTRIERGSESSEEVFHSLTEKTCEICFETIPHTELVDVPCGHYFCRDCWASYLEVSVREGSGKDIKCPGHNCARPVPMEIVGRLVSEELFRKFSDLNLQRFVDGQRDIKWCPFPDCGQAVLKKAEIEAEPSLGKVVGVNVECGNGHGFCWHCMKDAHEPCECELWDLWLQEIDRMRKETNVDMGEVAEQAERDAQWIINNTKPCPHCSSPIQKNEGCNHMICRNCAHEFCWVCLDPWRDHSYRTGGYFSCNRFQAQRRASSRVQEARKNMANRYRKAATEDRQKQVDKFIHYHDRYENHLLSIKLEGRILKESQAKARSLLSMRQLVAKKLAGKRGADTETIMVPAKTDEAENFLAEIVTALLHARRLLATSYGIGYLIPEERQEAMNAQETIQGKLEEIVEMLAQMVNRPYLNTPREDMTGAARNVEYICQELVDVMRGVVLTGFKVEEPPPHPQQPEAPLGEDEELEIDPIILFTHLALRHDPQFREIFQQLMAEQRQEQEGPPPTARIRQQL